MTEQEFNELKLGDEVELGQVKYLVVNIETVQDRAFVELFGSREVAVESYDGYRCYIYAKSNIDKFRTVPKPSGVTP